ncbi:hypothetical protein ACB094_11G031400 [Castanea mollissima]
MIVTHLKFWIWLIKLKFLKKLLPKNLCWRTIKAEKNNSLKNVTTGRESNKHRFKVKLFQCLKEKSPLCILPIWI